MIDSQMILSCLVSVQTVAIPSGDGAPGHSATRLGATLHPTTVTLLLCATCEYRPALAHSFWRCGQSLA